MRARLLFVIGLAAGYVVGARAGRSAYDAIVARAKGTAANPKVQDALLKAGALAEEKAPKATSAVQTVAQTAAETAEAVKQAPSGEESEEDEPAASESAAETPAIEEGETPPLAIDELPSSVTPDPLDEPTAPTATA